MVNEHKHDLSRKHAPLYRKHAQLIPDYIYAIDEADVGVILRVVVFGVALVVSCVVCRVVLFLLCVCVCDLFLFIRSRCGKDTNLTTQQCPYLTHTPSPYKSPKPPSLLMQTRHISK